MLKLLVIRWIKRAIMRKVRKKMFKKLFKEGGIAALVVGLISTVFGVDIAPDDVDKVITGVAVVAIYAPQIIDAIKAKFGKGDAE